MARRTENAVDTLKNQVPGEKREEREEKKREEKKREVKRGGKRSEGSVNRWKKRSL